MISILPNNQSDALAGQKSFVSLDFIPDAFKYCLIPLKPDLRTVTQLIPRKDIDSSYSILSTSVFQYSNWSSLADVVFKRTRYSSFKKEDVRILSPAIYSPTVDVSVVFKSSADANKWRKYGDLSSVVKDILILFTFVNSCLIVVPSEELGCEDIVYICVHNTCSKKAASRISLEAEVNVIETFSLSRFEQLCSNHDAFKVVGLDNQIRFLDLIYKAHSRYKHSTLPRETKFIQKVCKTKLRKNQKNN